MTKITVELGYHFVYDEDLDAMHRALEPSFIVKRIRKPGNIGPNSFNAAFIEIALGAFAGVVGAVALKKVM